MLHDFLTWSKEEWSIFLTQETKSCVRKEMGNSKNGIKQWDRSWVWTDRFCKERSEYGKKYSGHERKVPAAYHYLIKYNINKYNMVFCKIWKKFNFELNGLNGPFRNNAYNSTRRNDWFLLYQKEKNEVFNMAIGNGELRHECFPKYSRIGSARMK